MTDLITKYVFTSLTGTATLLTDVNSCMIDLGTELKNNSMRIMLKNSAVDLFAAGNVKHKYVKTDGTPVFKAVKVSRNQTIDEEYIDVYSLYTDDDPTIEIGRAHV